MAESSIDVEDFYAEDETDSGEESENESCSDDDIEDDPIGDECEEDENDDDDEEDDDDEDDEGVDELEVTEDNDLDVSLNDDDDNNPNSSQCPVCLMSLTGQQLGTPNNCQHVFCFLCISEWSKNSNTCPVDRNKFDEILVHTSKKGPVIKRVKVEEKQLSNQQEWEQAPTYCEICDQCNREAMMLLCDGCDRGYHMFCLTPRLYNVPTGDWYCDTCFVIRNETSLDEGVRAEDLLLSTSGASTVRTTSNRGRGSSSTRGRGGARRRTGSRTSTTRRSKSRSRSTSTRGKRKSKRGCPRKKTSTRRTMTSSTGRKTTSSTGRRKTRTKKTKRKSIKKSPKKKRKTEENNDYQSPLIPRTPRDRRPLGTNTALSILGDEFALHDFEASVEDALAEKPATPPRPKPKTSDVLSSIMDEIEVLHDDEARVSRDGSVLPSELRKQNTPPKNSSASPDKTNSTDNSPKPESRLEKEVSPLKRPCSPSSKTTGESKVRKVSFFDVSKKEPSHSRDVMNYSRDHSSDQLNGHSQDVRDCSRVHTRDHSSDHLLDQSRGSWDYSRGHPRDCSFDHSRVSRYYSRDHPRNFPPYYSHEHPRAHSHYQSRDYQRHYSSESQPLISTSLKEPRPSMAYQHAEHDKRSNSVYNRYRFTADTAVTAVDASKSVIPKDTEEENSSTMGIYRQSPSKYLADRTNMTSPLSSQSTSLVAKTSNNVTHTSSHTPRNTSHDVRESNSSTRFGIPHKSYSLTSAIRTSESDASRQPSLTSACSTTSPAVITGTVTSTTSLTDPIMSSKRDVINHQSLSSRFSSTSTPEVSMTSAMSNKKSVIRHAHQSLSSRFSSSSASSAVSAAAVSSNKSRLIEFEEKNRGLRVNVIPESQNPPSLPSVPANLPHPTLPRPKTFKASDSHLLRPKLKGLSNDKKHYVTLNTGHAKTSGADDTSYRQNLAIIDMLRAKKSTLKAEIKRESTTSATEGNESFSDGYSTMPSSFEQSEVSQSHKNANFHRPKLSSLLGQSSRKASLPVAVVRPSRNAEHENEAEEKQETSMPSLSYSHVTSHGDSSMSVVEAERVENRRKGIARLQRLTSIKDTVRLVLHPFYDHREITRTEFKDIFTRAVQKVNDSSCDVNYIRIADLVKKYVKKYKGLRTHRDRPIEIS